MQTNLSNQDIARLLKQVSAAYTIKGFNRFRIIAYDKSSEAIESSNIEVKDLWKEKRLGELSGVGPSIAAHLDELFTKGKVKNWEEAFKDLPKGMFPLLDIPGFGPKKAFRLAREYKLNDPETAVEDLLKIASEGKIANLEGFGEKSQEDIIDSLNRFKISGSKKKRMPLLFAQENAAKVMDYLKKSDFVKEVYTLGSLRRKVSTIGDIDIAAATDKPEEVLDWFLKYPKKRQTS